MGSGTVSSVPATPAPTVDEHQIVTMSPAASYATSTPEATVYAGLNDLRLRIGSGALKQNAALDKAAQAHWRYIDTNGFSPSHNETSAAPNFTGATPADRIAAAGYAGSVTSEVIYGETGPNQQAQCVANWANSVYHMAVLFTGVRDVGIAASDTHRDPVYGIYSICVVDVGVGAGQEQLPDIGVRTYPYADQVGVPFLFKNHSESPTPLPQYTELGTPIGVSFETKAGAAATISSFTLTDGAGRAFPATILVPASGVTAPAATIDTNVTPGMAYLLPTKPLTTKTRYTARLQGSNSKGSFDKSWSFQTE